jgi:hypothetical protein
MRLISSTLLTVAFLALFVAAPDPVTETLPVTTPTVTTPPAPGKPATTPVKATASSSKTTSSTKVVGILKEGDACVTKSKAEDTCADGLYCAIGGRFVSYKDPGYCVKNTRGDLDVGDVCVSWGCKKDLYCMRDPVKPQGKSVPWRSPKGKCVEKSKVGEACGGSHDCITNAFCLKGKCAPKKKKDEECPSSSECEGGLYCQKALTDKMGKCCYGRTSLARDCPFFFNPTSANNTFFLPAHSDFRPVLAFVLSS